jgi:hypothetical protein
MKEKVPDEVFEELLKELEGLEDHVMDFGKKWGIYACGTELTDEQTERMEQAVVDFQNTLTQLLERLGELENGS